jgi:hypothetical protein
MGEGVMEAGQSNDGGQSKDSMNLVYLESNEWDWAFSGQCLDENHWMDEGEKCLELHNLHLLKAATSVKAYPYCRDGRLLA